MKSIAASANLEARALACYLRSRAPKRACHFHELFVKNHGDVFPCCIPWERKAMRIGNVRDEDILEKIERFGAVCSCARFRLRKGKLGEKPKYSLLNIELSLQCQGSCTMCIVDAPGWHGEYHLYDRLDLLIDATRPEEILVQGGEVLIQKRSVEWLKALKERLPDLKISLVTNGCVPEATADAVEGLFSRVTVSFVGFQGETYRKVMGLDIDRTFAFVERLRQMKETRIFLKFLLTPVNVHETHLFLQWALERKPARIALSDALIRSYICETPDDYWKKIFDRTSIDVRRVIVDHLSLIKDEKIVLSVDQPARQVLGIDEEFIAKHDLGRNIDWT